MFGRVCKRALVRWRGLRFDLGVFGLTWGYSFRKVQWEEPEERYSPIRFSPRTIYPLDAERAALFGV